MKYTYTAIFTPTEDGAEIYAYIPDLPGCVTTGDTIEDAVYQITDAASNWLVVAEDEGLPVPVSTSQKLLNRPANCVLSLIQIDTIKYRELTDNRSVRKNVSLPAWMAYLADERNINCSQVLQDGLKAKLGA